MRNFLRLFSLLLLIGFIGWLVVPRHAQKPDYTSFLVTLSSDSHWEPGSRQELLVYVLNDKDTPLSHETGLQISARLTASHCEETCEKIINFPLAYLTEGAYFAGLEIPSGWHNGTAQLELFAADSPDQPIYSEACQIGKDIALAVLPPEGEVFAGSWVNFRIAAINRKNSEGLFKAPVRVKLTPPSGSLTINRVIHTDIDGTAIFTTHINPRAMPGIYEFEFSYGKELLQLNLQVSSHNRKNQLLTEKIKSEIEGVLPFRALLSSITPVKTSDSTYSIKPAAIEEPAGKFLSDIKLEKHQAFLNYDCSGSRYRQIEIWQNGRVIYTSDLQLDSGRISIPLNKPLQPSLPLRFKLWFINNDGIFVQEQVLTGNPETSSPVKKFLAEATLIFPQVAGQSFASTLFASQSLTGVKNRKELKFHSLTRQTNFIIESSGKIEEEEAGFAFFPVSESDQTPRQRFFLVDNELLLNRYRFSALKIWLSPRRFFTSMIGSLRPEKTNIDFLTGEAECRALRFPFLDLSEQAAELEKLEGLLIPLSDFYKKAKDMKPAHPSLARAQRAIYRLSRFIHVPDELKKMNGTPVDLSHIGPFSPVLPVEITIERLLNSLKPGGKANLISGDRCIALNLVDINASFKNSSYSGPDSKPEKLINTRAVPIVVELEFAESD